MYLKSKDLLQCYGCGACKDICPKNCITLVADEEGFCYPTIDSTNCVMCGKCEVVCPVSFSIPSNSKTVLVGVHRSEKVVELSSSGGAFTAICDVLLKKNYIVFGVRYDNLFVIHDSADSLESLARFRKSKYLIGDTNGAFTKIAKLLLDRKKVFFTGTPCQCAALLSFLEAQKIQRDLLITMDIVCHGGPNQTLFNTYIKELQGNRTITSFEFRNKRPINGKINSRSVYITYSNDETEIREMHDCSYLVGYHSRLFYRPSCSKCRFASPDRVSDITIGDAWGIEKVYPDLNPLNGVSLIITSTKSGSDLINDVAETMDLRPVSLEWAINNNDTLKAPTKFHNNRELFFKLYKKRGFDYAVKRSTKRPLYKRVLGWIKRTI